MIAYASKWTRRHFMNMKLKWWRQLFLISLSNDKRSTATPLTSEPVKNRFPPSINFSSSRKTFCLSQSKNNISYGMPQHGIIMSSLENKLPQSSSAFHTTCLINNTICYLSVYEHLLLVHSLRCCIVLLLFIFS